MAIIQISKIQQRSGNIVDLPQLDEAEFGWATDSKQLYIGKSDPNENIEVLTSYSAIDFDQITGAVGNLDIDGANIGNGQILTYNGSDWTNRGGIAGGLITLGDVSNVKIDGGSIGYVLETDGTGNLSWTPKSTISANISNITKANPAVVTTAADNFFTEGALVTITGVVGMTQVNGNSYYANVITANTFSLYSDPSLTTPVNSTGFTTYTSGGRAISSVGGSGSTSAGGSNTTIQFNNNNLLDGDAGFTWDYATALLNVNGNANVGNLNANGSVTSSRLFSNVATGTTPIVVTSTTRVANLNVNYANVSDFEVVTTQTTGTFYPVFVSGNTSANYALGSNANMSFNAATGNLSVSILNTTGIITANGNITSNGNITGSNFIGQSLANGNSNVRIATANGNVTISAVGNTTMTITGTGANITGTANISGNANVNNLGTTTLIATTGNITTVNGNIIFANILTASGNATGNANVSTVTGNLGIRAIFATYTDNSAAASATIVNAAIHAIAAPNLAAANATVTFTNASTFYIAGAPIANTNATITNPYALFVAAGNSYFGGNITGSNFIGSLANGNSNVNIPAANGNITLSVAGNANIIVATGTGVNVAGYLTATANIDANNINATNGVVASTLTSNVATGTAPLTVISTTRVANLNVAYANVSDYGAVTAQTTGVYYVPFVNGSTTANRALNANSVLAFDVGTGQLSATLLTGTLTTASQGNITTVGTLGSLSVTANVTTGGIKTDNYYYANGVSISFAGSYSNSNVAAYLPTFTGTVGATTLTAGANITAGTITGNWSLSAGSRLNATYADLAEYYEADTEYEAGTVLEFGGDKEVTLATDETMKVAGVVSSNPAYVMNATCQGIAVPIALQGRVPCKVRGIIHKGDMMISGGNGYARPTHSPIMGTVIGKALENFSGEGIIEIAIGRL